MLAHNLEHALMITTFVFLMMVLVDYVNVLTQGRMNNAIKGGLFRQYVIASLLGATPGCLGAFMNVSFYIHGLLSFGAMVGGMIATCGDEAFVMLTLFPDKAMMLFGILFVLGIASAWLTDKVAPLLKIRPCQECQLSVVHLQEECRCLTVREIIGNLKQGSLARFLLLALLVTFIYGFSSGTIGPDSWNWQRITFVLLLLVSGFVVLTVPEHYLEDHIWTHIIKRHLWRVFLWSFGALLIVDVGLRFWDLEAFVKSHIPWLLLISSLIALIPESGPHLIFVMMFAKGMLPFSVLIASSIIQDGHGMLPLLSYTIKDSILIKIFNFIIGLGVGFILYMVGI